MYAAPPELDTRYIHIIYFQKKKRPHPTDWPHLVTCGQGTIFQRIAPIQIEGWPPDASSTPAGVSTQEYS